MNRLNQRREWLCAAVAFRDRSACWTPIDTDGVWTGSLSRPGFDEFTLASHAALELDGRPRPPVGEARNALHSCDNEMCFNPGHLRWGDDQDNVNDMRERNRANYVHGESNGLAKIDEAMATRIIDRLRLPYKSIRQVADELHVSVPIVRNISNNRTWRHLVRT